MGEHRNKKISVRQCEQIREWRKRGKSLCDIGDRFDVSHDCVSHHAYGECKCDTAVSPAEKRSGNASEEECQQWRRDAHDGRKYTDIAEEEPYTYQTVITHCRGKCSCEHDVPPVEKRRGPGKIGEDVCWHMTYLYAVENMRPDEIMQIVELEYGIELDRGSTVTYHATGACGHDLPLDE